MHSRKLLNQQPRSGFSLVEILIVIALIAALAGIMITKLDTFLGQGSEGVAEIFVNETLEPPLVLYRLNMGSYPSTEQGLKALVQAPSGAGARWKGPYVDEIPLDPWGNPYKYKRPGSRNPDRYDIWSLGPDGSESADDIGNWKK